MFLSVCSQWNVTKAEHIVRWFSNIHTIHGLNDIAYRKLTVDLLKNTFYENLVKAFLKKVNLGIIGIELIDASPKAEEILKGLPEDLREEYKGRIKEDLKKSVFTLHNKYNSELEVVDQVPFFLDSDESEGTKKFFNVIGVILSSILENKIVIIDEFDARLHTLLTKAILKLYNSDKIKSSSQLLASCHDTSLIDRRILRRDQIYLIEKNRYGASILNSLVEFKPRKEEALDKNYLQGKYGGIPFIDDIESLFEDASK